MATLKNALAKKIPGWRDEFRSLAKEHGEKVVCDVVVRQVLGGMRGIKSMICDTSEVPPDKGLLIRGTPIGDLADREPEEIFYLLCTGDLPDKKALTALRKEYTERQKVPTYVWKVLEAMPRDSHPMCMFDTGILVMERESAFRAAYSKGVKKEDYWKSTLEDALTLLARLPGLAAGVYRLRFKKGKRIAPKAGLSWSENYVRMLGFEDPNGEFADCMRLYLTLHCDHEGGNVSAHATHLVGSALSDLYYGVSAGLNGLSGPLHGLANQECLGWIIEVRKKFKGVPTDKQLRDFAWKTLNSGKVIPGYGHAVLRVTDPRFTGFNKFGKQYTPSVPVFLTGDRVFTGA